MHFNTQQLALIIGLAALISAQSTSGIPQTFPVPSATQPGTTHAVSTPAGSSQSTASRTGSLSSATGTASASGSSLTGSRSLTGTLSGTASSSHSSSGTASLSSRPTNTPSSTNRALTTTSSSSSASPTATDDSSLSDGSSKGGKKKKFGSGAGIIVGVIGFIGIIASSAWVWWKKHKKSKKSPGSTSLSAFLAKGRGDHEALPLTSNVGGPSPATHTPYSDAPHPPPPQHGAGAVYAGDPRGSLSNATLIAPQGQGSHYNMNDNPYSRSDASVNQSYPNPFDTAGYNPSSGYSYPAQQGQHR